MRIEKLAVMMFIVLVTIYALLIIAYMHTAINEKLHALKPSGYRSIQVKQVYEVVERVTNGLFNALYILIIILAIASVLEVILHG